MDGLPDPARPADLGALYLDAGWHQKPFEFDLERSIASTTHWIRATRSGSQTSVGAVRLQTDHVFYCAIYDLIVRSDHRGHGIGIAIMDEAIAWARGAGVRLLHLWPTPGAADYYKRFGFEALGAEQP